MWHYGYLAKRLNIDVSKIKLTHHQELLLEHLLDKLPLARDYNEMLVYQEIGKQKKERLDQLLKDVMDNYINDEICFQIEIGQNGIR